MSRAVVSGAGTARGYLRVAAIQADSAIDVVTVRRIRNEQPALLKGTS